MSSPIFLAGPPNKRIRSQCIVCIKPCDEIRSFTQEQWDNFKLTALMWKDLDKFGDVYERINWENGPQNICHRNCVSYMQTSRKFEQAKNRSKKQPRRLLPLLHSKPAERENIEVSAPPQPPPPRTLQGLLLDYRNILFELAQVDKEPKTSIIKSSLIEETKKTKVRICY